MNDIIAALVIGGLLALFTYLLLTQASKAQKGDVLVKATRDAVSPTLLGEKEKAKENNNHHQEAAEGKGNNNNKKKLTKAEKKKLQEEEEAEDRLIEEELKKNSGIRKDKVERIDLEEVHSKSQEKAQRASVKAHGAQFSEKQVAAEKSRGFKVVGQEKKPENQSAAASSPTASSPTAAANNSNNNNKKNKKSSSPGGRQPLTREQELDMAIRSVLSKKGGGGGRGAGGRGGGKGGDDDFTQRTQTKTPSPHEEKGFVEIKGEISKAKKGGSVWASAN